MRHNNTNNTNGTEIQIDDPLKRIQDEINEVARREQELRELNSSSNHLLHTVVNGNTECSDGDGDGGGGGGEDSTVIMITSNGNGNNNNNSNNINNHFQNNNSISNDDNNNNSSANSILNGSDSHDISTISDDSGISSASSPINGTSANIAKSNNNSHNNSNTNCNNNNNSSSSNNNNNFSSNIITREFKYIRSNTINPTSSQIQQKQQQQQQQQEQHLPLAIGTTAQKLTRALSTPQIFIPAKRFTINTSTSQKGIMRRFIASRGKIPTATNHLNGSLPLTPSTESLNRSNYYLSPMANLTPPIIERDEDGRPLRRGYVPVEEKIQKELRDMKSREMELRKIRRKHLLRSQPNLTEDITTTESDDYDTDLDNEEHCFGPRKLRSSKSISELCDTINNNNLDARDTPSPQLYARDMISNGANYGGGGIGTLRPAVSLAQLCDIDPDEAPTSHQLIAQWETIIQKKQQQVA